MHVEYDSETDAAFIFLVPDEMLGPGLIAHEVWPPECSERVGLLFNEEEQLVGIEVLFASAVLPAELLKSARPTPGGVT